MSRSDSLAQTEFSGAGAGMLALVRMLRILFFLLRILIVVVLVYLAFSGVFYVRTYEEAMLFRFGKLQVRDGREILTSGKWYWAWPYPIDRVQRIPAQRSVTITSTQFWPQLDPTQIQAAEGTSPVDEKAQALRPGETGYLLTGDANIMHMVSTVTYRIVDARKYYLRFYQDDDSANGPGADAKPLPRRGADVLIRSVLDSAVLAEVARWPVESVLVLSRSLGEDGEDETFANAVRRRVMQRLEQLDIGVEVQQVSLPRRAPPVVTQAAFQQVNDASQENSTLINTAQAYEKRVVTEAEGTASRILADAEAYKIRIVESVKSEKTYFDKVLDEYNKNPRTMLVTLYTDTIRDALNQVETKYVIHARSDGRQEIRLLLGPEPTRPGSSAAPAPGTPGR